MLRALNVCGRNGIGRRNARGRRLLEFYDEIKAVRGKQVILKGTEKENNW